jgi:hypothetical protein
MHMGHVQRSRIADTFCPDTQRHANHSSRQIGIISLWFLGLTPRLVLSLSSQQLARTSWKSTQHD